MLRGLIDNDDYHLEGAVLECWDAFVDLADRADLATKTRLDGWRVREILVHLGTWEGRSSLTGVVETLGADEPGEAPDPDAVNAALIEAHRTASDEEVRAALRASRDAVAELLESDLARERGTELVMGPLGAMPLLTVVHAACYELALHALDIAEAVDESCDPALLSHGISALADSTGCLAARSGIDAEVSIVVGDDGWTFDTSEDGGWRTAAEHKPRGTRLAGSAVDLLEASSGRADPVRLIARRRLRISHLGGLLALAPLVDQVPGLPGGRVLAVAAKSLGGVGSILRRK
ncbi:MAG: hypothetical protein JWP31_2403 [Aeromicrobium sp.]|nr:hypothetical protein [Aeromicrobium sp.]